MVSFFEKPLYQFSAQWRQSMSNKLKKKQQPKASGHKKPQDRSGGYFPKQDSKINQRNIPQKKVPTRRKF